VATAITNLDLHDIARSAHTYGISPFYIVHPVAVQRELAQRVQDHWTVGSGARRIPDRGPPMRLLRVVGTFDEVVDSMGPDVEIWATSAKPAEPALTFRQARKQLREGRGPVLLLFGTGWGLAPQLLQRAHACLEPIASPRLDGYNHLSVRAAAAISFDRLMSQQFHSP
jgi:hypothetical protein